MLWLALGCTGRGETVDTATPQTPEDSASVHQAAEPVVVSTRGVPRNLLVISIDTLRRDRVGFLGSDHGATPVLDALAAQGAVLEDHHSCANWTFPAVLCAQTGRTTLQLEFQPDPGTQTERYEGVWPTLEVRLADAGFRTALTTTNNFFHPTNGTATGFEDVTLLSYEPSDAAFGAALPQLQALVDSGERFYQHVHLFDPHTPYLAEELWWGDTGELAPLAWDISTEGGIDELLAAYGTLSAEEQAEVRVWLDVRYQADLRKMDAGVAAFLDQAAAAGALQDTLVLVWSDHGEQLFEDGLFGHGRDLHDEETDAVALFWMADGGLAPVRWAGPTVTWDLVPTVLDLLGLEPSPDFTGWVVGTAPADRRRLGVHWSYSESMLSLEKSVWKLIYGWDGSIALYDRTRDRSEQVDLAASERERAAELWGLLRPRVRDLSALKTGAGTPREPDL